MPIDTLANLEAEFGSGPAVQPEPEMAPPPPPVVEQRAIDIISAPPEDGDEDRMGHRAALEALFSGIDPAYIDEDRWGAMFEVKDPMVVKPEEIDELIEVAKAGNSLPVRPGWGSQLAKAVKEYMVGETMGAGAVEDMRAGEQEKTDPERVALAYGLKAMASSTASVEELRKIAVERGGLPVNPVYLTPEGRFLSATYRDAFAKTGDRAAAMGIALSAMAQRKAEAQEGGKSILALRTLGMGKEVYSANRSLPAVVATQPALTGAGIVTEAGTATASVIARKGRGLAQLLAEPFASELTMAKLAMPTKTEAEVAEYRRLLSEVPVEGDNKFIEKATRVANLTAQSVADTAINLAMIQAATGSPYAGAVRWKDSFMAGVGKTAWQSAKFAGFQAMTEPGNDRERLMAGVMATLYNMTPAFSRMATPATAVFTGSATAQKLAPVFVDMMANIGLTQAFIDQNYSNALSEGMKEAQEDGQNEYVGMLYGALNMLAIAPMDVIPSIMVGGAGVSSARAVKRGAKAAGMDIASYKQGLARVAKSSPVEIIQGEGLFEKTSTILASPYSFTGRPIDLYRRSNGEKREIAAKNAQVISDISPLVMAGDGNAVKMTRLLTDVVNGMNRIGTPIELCPVKAPDRVNPASPEEMAQLEREGYTPEEIAKFAREGKVKLSYAWLETEITTDGERRARLHFVYDTNSEKAKVLKEGFAPDISAKEVSHEIGHALEFLEKFSGMLKGEQAAQKFERMFPEGITGKEIEELATPGSEGRMKALDEELVADRVQRTAGEIAGRQAKRAEGPRKYGRIAEPATPKPVPQVKEDPVTGLAQGMRDSRGEVVFVHEPAPFVGPQRGIVQHSFRADTARKSVGLDADIAWKLGNAWVDQDGNVHIGEPSGGSLGKARAGLSGEMRRMESPTTTLTERLGIRVPFLAEETGLPAPVLEALGDGGIVNPHVGMWKAQKYVEAANTTLTRTNPVAKKLFSFRWATTGVKSNKAGTSLYANAVNAHGQELSVRISDHEPTPGETESRYPYDVDFRVSKEAMSDPAKMAEELHGAEVVEKMRSAAAKKDAIDIQERLRAGTAKRGAIREKVDEVVAFLRGPFMPPQHGLRLLETDNTNDLTDPMYEGPLSQFHTWFHNGQNVRWATRLELLKGLRDAKKVDNWDGDGVEDKQAFTANGAKVLLNKSDMMYVYLVQRDVRGKQYLTGEQGQGFLLPSMAKDKKANAITMTPEDISSVVSAVEKDAEMMAISRSLTGGMLRAFAYINATSMPEEGRNIATDVAHWVLEVEKSGELPFSTMEVPGGWQDNKNIIDLVNQGPLRKRKEDTGGILVGSDPIKTFAWYADVISRYVGMAPVVNRINAIMAQGEMSGRKGAIKQHLPKAGEAFLRDLVDDYNHGGHGEYSSRMDKEWTKKAENRLSAFSVSKLGFNIPAAFMQVVSYETSRPFFSRTAFLNGESSKPASMEEMMDSNPSFVERYSSLDAFTEGFIHGGSRQKSIAFKPILIGDRVAVGRIFNAAKKEVELRNPELKGREFKYAVGELTERVVMLSQSPTSIVDRPALLRGKNPYARAFLGMFTSQINTNYGIQTLLARTAIEGVKNGDARAVAKAAEGMFYAAVLQWAMVAVLQSVRREITLSALEAIGMIEEPEEDEGGFWQNAARQFGMNIIGDRGMLFSRMGKEAYAVLYGQKFSGMITPVMMRISKSAMTLADEDASIDAQDRAMVTLVHESLVLIDSFLGTGYVTALRDAIGATALAEKLANK